MSTKIDNRSPINVSRLTMWTLKKDAKSYDMEYDTTPHEFENQLNSFTYTPSVTIAEQYGDGVKVEDCVVKSGGTCGCVVRAFSTEDENYLFGSAHYESKVEGATENVQTLVSNKDDVIPYVCVAFMTRRSDGLVNLYKFPKVKWMPQGETLNQQEGTQIQFGTASLSGNYVPTLSDGNDMYKVTGIDPKGANANFINAWFTTATVTSPDDVTA